MIKKPNEMTFTDKKFSMILYGAPGVGKTTLALSAPDPILIDFDRGVSRVKAYHREDNYRMQYIRRSLGRYQIPRSQRLPDNHYRHRRKFCFVFAGLGNA